MRVEHTLTMVSKCPMNELQDVYEVTFIFDRTVEVEKLLEAVAAFASEKIFQEKLTTTLAMKFAPCEVKTVGVHSGVKTVVHDNARSEKDPSFEDWEAPER